MSNDKEPTPTVLAIDQMGFDGHIIPHTWYDHITYKTEKGTEKVDLQAIVILSDIVYWYRPKKIVDETTGRLLRLERRFAADKLQRNYQQIANLFGLSKTQATRAVKRLRDRGLITMEFRTIETKRGPIFNALYLDLVPERLAEITYKRVETPLQNRKDLLTKTGSPLDKNEDTYTEITPEIIPETTPEKKAVSEKPKPDILDAMVHYGIREQPVNWSVPAAAGGADDWVAAVDAFAELTGVAPGLLTKSERREWGRVLERVGAARNVGPGVVVEVIRKVPDSEDNWRTFSKPHEIEAVLKKLIGQHLNSGIRGPRGRSGTRPISKQIAEYRAKMAQQDNIIEGSWEVI